jgi:hypothetical protein
MHVHRGGFDQQAAADALAGAGKDGQAFALKSHSTGMPPQAADAQPSVGCDLFDHRAEVIHMALSAAERCCFRGINGHQRAFAGALELALPGKLPRLLRRSGWRFRLNPVGLGVFSKPLRIFTSDSRSTAG